MADPARSIVFGVDYDLNRQIELSLAYNISYEVGIRSTAQLFWTVDRFYHDIEDIGPDGRAQRFEAIQRIAAELDRRNVPVRDPNGPKAYPGVLPN